MSVWCSLNSRGMMCPGRGMCSTECEEEQGEQERLRTDEMEFCRFLLNSAHTLN